MTTTIMSAVIVGLIILLVVLFLKIAQLSHKLKLSDKDNEGIRTKFIDLEIKLSELNSKHAKEISNLKEAHSKEITNINKAQTKEITNLEKEHKAEIVTLQKKISKLSEGEDIFLELVASFIMKKLLTNQWSQPLHHL